MTLRDLYPFWDDAHAEFLETLERVSADEWAARPVEGVQSIQQLAVDFLHAERFWAAHLLAGFEWEPPRLRDYPTPAAATEALAAQRQVTAQMIEPLALTGLRAVRLVPADPHTNRPETNMTVGCLLWRVLELELMCWGQITLRLADARAALETRA